MKNFIGQKLNNVKYLSVNMARKKRDNGHDSFDLIPEKAHILHDDRSYTLALCGWSLSEERRKLIMNKPKDNNSDLLNKLLSRMKPSVLK